jgi:Cu/Zn superoxide dismutase
MVMPALKCASALFASLTIVAASASAQSGSGRELTAMLTAVAGATGSGSATVTINPGQNEICYELEVSGIDPAPFAAHIHISPSGSIVVPLAAPTGGSSSGCVTADRKLLVAILKDPDRYYINVHNATFPSGVVSGFLMK